MTDPCGAQRALLLLCLIPSPAHRMPGMQPQNTLCHSPGSICNTLLPLRPGVPACTLRQLTARVDAPPPPLLTTRQPVLLHCNVLEDVSGHIPEADHYSGR